MNNTTSALEAFNQQGEKLTWDYISGDGRLNWNEEFLEQHLDKINWTTFSQNIHPRIYNVISAIRRPKPVREVDYLNFLEKYEAYLDWNVLSSKDFGLYMSDEVLKLFADKLNWPLLIEGNLVDWKYEHLKLYDSYLSDIPIEKLQESGCWKTIIAKMAKGIYKQANIEWKEMTIEEILEAL